ncbi:hypothetical protein KDN34_02590 [Shewanella yunxiaonensis]|uniref:DUF8051 domain-containing protein n=1 Tax=Shewanella yunxiaonensis TaxID=2829809 RepID=A0ABX7YUE2_9GAMM|nr:hypothetical protein [Shewanella yunxiaonensis]QUN06373.1 hypothetical protein KDN34_02590 [Shewanella yunxiaonensis]
MEHYIVYVVSGLLGTSAVLLGLLIPGGPIETRDFSHISPMTLGIFNVFLTVLGIGSLALIYFSFIGSEIAVIMAAICGVSYFLVYALDLAKIFPVSPNKMPRALFWIEVIGLILSIPLTLLSLIYLLLPTEGAGISEVSPSTMLLGLVAVIVVGAGIVIFATKSAMRQREAQGPSR